MVDMIREPGETVVGYPSPDLARLLHPEMEIGGRQDLAMLRIAGTPWYASWDGGAVLKEGYVVLERLPIPPLSLRERILLALPYSLKAVREVEALDFFVRWGEAWLADTDRSHASAETVAQRAWEEWGEQPISQRGLGPFLLIAHDMATASYQALIEHEECTSRIAAVLRLGQG